MIKKEFVGMPDDKDKEMEEVHVQKPMLRTRVH